MVLEPLVWSWGRDTAPGPRPLQAGRVGHSSMRDGLCHRRRTPRVLHMGHLQASTVLGGSGWVPSLQPWASPPVFSCLQLAVELHPGESCHSPGTSTTVQQQPGQPRVSGRDRHVLDSVLLPGPARGLCPQAVPGEVAACCLLHTLQSLLCPHCMSLTGDAVSA